MVVLWPRAGLVAEMGRIRKVVCAQSAGEKLEEERRLAFVGIERAYGAVVAPGDDEVAERDAAAALFASIAAAPAPSCSNAS